MSEQELELTPEQAKKIKRIQDLMAAYDLYLDESDDRDHRLLLVLDTLKAEIRQAKG